MSKREPIEKILLDRRSRQFNLMTPRERQFAHMKDREPMIVISESVDMTEEDWKRALAYIRNRKAARHSGASERPDAAP